MGDCKHILLGPGISVSDGRGYCSPQRPKAWPTLDGRWQAEISGVEDGTVVRSWVGRIYRTKRGALSAAIAAVHSEARSDV